MKINKQIQAEISVNGQDIANYIGQLWNKNEQIQIVLKFIKRIDFMCLKKAVRLSIDAEPILGCGFVIENGTPIWRRHKDLDFVSWCTLIESENLEEMLHTVLSKPFNSKDYQLEVYLLRSTEKDMLCIKINHSCSDGGGAKYYLHLLNDIYSKIIKDANFYPEINDNGNRSGNQIFEKLNIINPITLINPEISKLKPTWAFPYQKGEVEGFNYSIMQLSVHETNQLILYTKENAVTMNDLILTAYYRALFSMVGPVLGQAMEICVTMDLRKYLLDGKAGAICNLSGVLNHRISREAESSETTLARVVYAMKQIKKDNPGLHSAASLEMLSCMDFETAAASIKGAWEESVHSGKSTINLSNFGMIASETLYFGEIEAEDAFMVTPVFKAPSFMLGTSTYKNKLSFTVGFCEPEVREEDVKLFLSNLKKELDEFVI